MTIVVATRDRMVSDSRLTVGESHYEIGKIFRLPGGGLMATAGDGRLTYPFERALMRGEEPEPIENPDDDEDFEAVVLTRDSTLIFHEKSYSPYPVGNPWVVIGSSQAAGAALYVLKHGARAEEAVAAGIEVDTSCGGKVVTVLLRDVPELLKVHGGRKPRAKA